LRVGRVTRALALTILAALVAAVVPACSSSQPYYVSLSVEPRVEGTTLIIEGNTSLPDGARLRYAAASNMATWKRLAGWVVCSKSGFRTGEDISSWPAGQAQVTVTFDPEAAGQPKDLRKRCGKNARLLAGSCVVRRGPGKVAETRGAVTIPGPRAASGAPSLSPAEPTVYITDTGDKYHSLGCRYLSRSSIPLNLGEAKARGYTPCSVCRPPR